MKLMCDLCGGELKLDDYGEKAVCLGCGLEYGADRLSEKQAELRRPIAEECPIEKHSCLTYEVPLKRPAVPSKKDNAKMKVMWTILVLVGLFAFFGTIFAGDDQMPTVFVVSLAVTVVTLFIFKPWKVYGGKII